MSNAAQRVGGIANYTQPAKGPHRFDVIPVGKEKGLKCAAWPNIGSQDSPQPNPVWAAYQTMTAVQLPGPWCIGGYEEVYTHQTHGPIRQFYATSIRPAQPGDENIFTMEKDGKPLGSGGAAAANGAGATGGAATAHLGIAEFCVAQGVLLFCAGKAPSVDQGSRMVRAVLDGSSASAPPPPQASPQTAPDVPASRPEFPPPDQSVVPADADW